MKAMLLSFVLVAIFAGLMLAVARKRGAARRRRSRNALGFVRVGGPNEGRK